MAYVSHILVGRPVFSVTEDMTVADVARRMAELKVGAIMVLDQGRLSGLFSERDLMTRVVVAGLDPGKTLVREVMSTHLATIDESATVEQAMQTMHDRGCRHLPVMRDSEVAGFISMRDLMAVELESKTEELMQMRAYIMSA